jgi:hypothetical protein
VVGVGVEGVGVVGVWVLVFGVVDVVISGVVVSCVVGVAVELPFVVEETIALSQALIPVNKRHNPSKLIFLFI